MNKLGGRKFIGFIVLTAAGMIAALKGSDISPGVVGLLLGAYGVFAASNSFNSKQSSGKSPAQLDETINQHLNSKVAPYLQQLAQSDQQMQAVMNKVIEQMKPAEPAVKNKQLVQDILNGTNPYQSQG